MKLIKINIISLVIFNVLILLSLCKTKEDSFNEFLMKYVKDIKDKEKEYESDTNNQNKSIDQSAQRMMQYYFQIFKLLNKDNNEYISIDELNEAAIKYNWNISKDEIKNIIISITNNDNKLELTFPQFIKFMDSIWNSNNIFDDLKVKFERAKEYIGKAYDFIISKTDSNNPNGITQTQVYKGFSSFIGYDIKMTQVQNLFKLFAVNGNIPETINKAQFIYGVINHVFDETIELTAKNMNIPEL